MDAALSVLPSALELDDSVAPTASMGIAVVGGGNLGMYHEAMLILPCLFQGQPHRFDVMFMVNNDMAFALGRETHGSAKKIGNVGFEHRVDGLYGYAERLGHRVLSIAMVPEAKMEPDPASMNVVPSVSCRVIGQPVGYGETDVTIDLIQTPAKWELLEQWSGQGTIGFPEPSAIDNWGVLPVRKIVSAFYSKMNIECPIPNLLARM
jgi:acetoacetate decarboxylase